MSTTKVTLTSQAHGPFKLEVAGWGPENYSELRKELCRQHNGEHADGDDCGNDEYAVSLLEDHSGVMLRNKRTDVVEMTDGLYRTLAVLGVNSPETSFDYV